MIKFISCYLQSAAGMGASMAQPGGAAGVGGGSPVPPGASAGAAGGAGGLPPSLLAAAAAAGIPGLPGQQPGSTHEQQVLQQQLMLQQQAFLRWVDHS